MSLSARPRQAVDVGVRADQPGLLGAPPGEAQLVAGLTLASCSAVSRMAALPEPLSLMPGPSPHGVEVRAGHPTLTWRAVARRRPRPASRRRCSSTQPGRRPAGGSAGSTSTDAGGRKRSRSASRRTNASSQASRPPGRRDVAARRPEQQRPRTQDDDVGWPRERVSQPVLRSGPRGARRGRAPARAGRGDARAVAGAVGARRGAGRGLPAVARRRAGQARRGAAPERPGARARPAASRPAPRARRRRPSPAWCRPRRASSRTTAPARPSRRPRGTAPTACPSTCSGSTCSALAPVRSRQDTPRAGSVLAAYSAYSPSGVTQPMRRLSALERRRRRAPLLRQPGRHRRGRHVGGEGRDVGATGRRCAAPARRSSGGWARNHIIRTSTMTTAERADHVARGLATALLLGRRRSLPHVARHASSVAHRGRRCLASAPAQGGPPPMRPMSASTSPASRSAAPRPRRPRPRGRPRSRRS